MTHAKPEINRSCKSIRTKLLRNIFLQRNKRMTDVTILHFQWQVSLYRRAIIHRGTRRKFQMLPILRRSLKSWNKKCSESAIYSIAYIRRLFHIAVNIGSGFYLLCVSVISNIIYKWFFAWNTHDILCDSICLRDIVAIVGRANLHPRHWLWCSAISTIQHYGASSGSLWVVCAGVHSFDSRCSNLLCPIIYHFRDYMRNRFSWEIK